MQLNASFARKMPAAGRIAFLSQSGALCTAVLDYAREKGIGFSKFVSFGNKAGVTEIELFDYLHEDPQTDVILLYLEELRDGRGLIEVARRITRGDQPKPILAIKSGRTPQGADAAASHTGSLAGEDAICDAVFREAGIIRVTSIEELFNAAILYAYQPLPAGNRLAHRHQRRRAGRDGHRRGDPLRPARARVWPRRPWRSSASRCPPRPTSRTPWT